ncbi:MAG: hypothetical protein EOO01_16695, partial [Chitinophagaceae bacterium]
MQFKETRVRLSLFISRSTILKASLVMLTALLSQLSFSQATYLGQGDKQNILLERLEIKAGTDSVLNFSKTRYFNRHKYVINGVRNYLRHHDQSGLSKTDAYNLKSIYLNNMEFLTDEERAQYQSKKPIQKNFYATPANLYDVHVKDFDLIINPVFQYTLSKESDNDQHLF